MAVQMLCPKCRKPLSVGQEQVGGSLNCPHCHASFRVNPSRTSQSAAGPAPEKPSASLPPAGKNALPARIGRYEIRGKLGEGAFGVVLKGHDASLGRDVAIKLLRAEKLVQKPGARGNAAVQRLLREARAVAQLRHENIVQVFELSEHEGSPYIVSEFIPGRDLASLIADHEEGLEPARAVRLILQLLDALTHAHEKNIIHRDIKPNNAMVDAADKVYLMDFGLAGWIEQEESRMTADGTVMGTPAYMPPEQAGGQVDQIGPPADQYSAGVALYELLTGNLPFSAPSLTVLLAQVLSAKPTPLREWRADLDPKLEALCLKALAKKPQDRYASCREFAGALRAWIGASGSSTPAPAPSKQTVDQTKAADVLNRSTIGPQAVKEPTVEASPRPVQAPEGTPPARKTWVILALAALVLLLVGAAGFAVMSGLRKEQKPPPSKDPKGIFKQLNDK